MSAWRPIVTNYLGDVGVKTTLFGTILLILGLVILFLLREVLISLIIFVFEFIGVMIGFILVFVGLGVLLGRRWIRRVF